MENKGKMYVVMDIVRAPLDDHLLHGYETRADFRRELKLLSGRWKGRVGECVGERHGFLLLRFHDTPGGKADEEWIPRYLLEPVGDPGSGDGQEAVDDKDETDVAVDTVFGFD